MTTKIRRKRPVYFDAERNEIKDPRVRTDVRHGICNACGRRGLLLTEHGRCKPDDPPPDGEVIIGKIFGRATEFRERRAAYCLRVAAKRQAKS